jgi:hypothetical protein
VLERIAMMSPWMVGSPRCAFPACTVISLQAARSALFEIAGIRSQTASSPSGTPTRGGAPASPAALSRMVSSTAATKAGHCSAAAVATASNILIGYS